MIFVNKYVLTGIGLIIAGMILSPIIIGMPIMIAGFLVGDFGIAVSFIKTVPGLESKIRKTGKLIADSYKPFFKKKYVRK